jgi:hypothetical protein
MTNEHTIYENVHGERLKILLAKKQRKFRWWHPTRLWGSWKTKHAVSRALGHIKYAINVILCPSATLSRCRDCSDRSLSDLPSYWQFQLFVHGRADPGRLGIKWLYRIRSNADSSLEGLVPGKLILVNRRDRRSELETVTGLREAVQVMWSRTLNSDHEALKLCQRAVVSRANGNCVGACPA